MNKTHKKVLGFAGLGLVAAVTTVAAIMPAPTAAALSADVMDELMIRVSSDMPELVATSKSGTEVTDGVYKFNVIYNHITTINATIVNKDDDGNTIGSATIWSENLGGAEGEKDFELSLENYGGYGNYTITIKGDGVADEGEEVVPVEQILTFKYTKSDDGGDDSGDDDGKEEGTDDDGNADIDIDVPTEEVKSVVVNVYDSEGNKVAEIEMEDPSEVESIDLGKYGLDNGVYTMEVVSYDDEGNEITTEKETVLLDKKTVDVEIEEQDEEVGKVVIVVKDSEGNVVKTVEVDDPTTGDSVSVDLSDLPNGDYTVSVEYYDEEDEKIDETTETVTKEPTTVEIPIEEQDEEVGKVTIVVKDEEGNVVKTIEIDNPATGTNYDLDLSDLPGGNYTIEVEYTDEEGEEITTTTTDITKTDSTGTADVDIETQVDTVTTVEAYLYNSDGELVRYVVADRATGTVYVYDANGNLLFAIPNGYVDDESLTVPLNGLEEDDYTTVITYKDKNGKIVGNSKTVKIKYDGDGNAIVVPDTGSFFQGLNISREDYLITGLIVFVIIGVVASGVIIRNKATRTSKKGRR